MDYQESRAYPQRYFTKSFSAHAKAFCIFSDYLSSQIDISGQQIITSYRSIDIYI